MPLLPRGGGTSQSGQTVGRALVMDFSKYLKRLICVDPAARTCVVEPGIVLEDLNRQLSATGLWFPVDVSTASRATIGGMTGNNSCGTRSIRYGIMRDNVISIAAVLADGSELTFGEVGRNLAPLGPVGDLASNPATIAAAPGPDAGDDPAALSLVRDMLALGRREAAHIAQAFPEVSRRVGGYLIDALRPGPEPVNLATLLCGSEGTLAVSRRIELKLSPLPKNKALGICHFGSFRKAMETPQHIVKLNPVAVEVVDRTLIELARDIAMFRPVMETYVRGRPDALLLVEFAEDEQAENLRRLHRLDELLADLGHPNSVVKVTDATGQKAVWDVRASGLNIMMSMKSEGKPVSVHRGLRRTPRTSRRLHGTAYRHLRDARHARHLVRARLGRLPARAPGAQPEAGEGRCDHARDRRGSLRHGQANTRARTRASMATAWCARNFTRACIGAHTVRLFEEVKDRFDPNGLMNPGKIVRSPRMDDRGLFRFKPCLPRRGAHTGVRLVGLSRCRRRVPGRG